MRLSKTVLGGAILMSVALSACTTPGKISRSEENRRQIEAEFGPVGPRSNPEAFRMNGDEGNGFSMFRLYSEKPMPNIFSSSVPEQFDNTLVVDVGIDIRIEDRFPLYRIGIDPTKISQRRVDLWPSHVLVEGAGGIGAPRKLAARLPQTRIPGADGMIWSDWTYCADCFGLEGIRDADVDTAAAAFAPLNKAIKAASAKNGASSIYGGRASFTVTPGVGILIGDAARDMAHKASDVIAASVARVDEMRPARAAYESLRKDFEASRSPAREIDRLCGTYEPNRDTISLPAEKERIEAYLACGAATIDGFDSATRHDAVASYRAYEQDMAAKAGLKPEDRIVFPTYAQEVREADAMLDAARDRYFEFASAVGGPAGPVAAPAKPAPAVPVQPAVPSTEDLVKSAGAAIAASTETSEVKGKPKQETAPEKPEPATRDTYYVARLLPNGGNMDIGQQKTGCIGGMECETGSIVALIAATGYCKAEGELTKTSSNWGMLVQRYRPTTRDQEKQIVAGDGESKIHVVTDDDKTAMSEGLKAVRALTTDEDQVFFTSYQSFYEVNTEKKGCKDMWRDSSKNHVIQNPAAALAD